MLPQAPGTATPSATDSLSEGLAASAAAAPPDAAPPVEAPPAPDPAGAPPAPDAPAGPASGATTADAASSPAPAAPVAVQQVAQAQQQLVSHAQALQEGWNTLEQRAATLQARAAELQALWPTLPPEQQELLRPRADALLREDAALKAQAGQVRDAWGQLGLAHEYLRVQAKEAELEQLSGPISLELLIRREAAKTPALQAPEAQEQMRQALARYDPNTVAQYAEDYGKWLRGEAFKARAAAGTDQMGPGASAAPPPANTTGAEDIATALRAAHAQGLTRGGRRV